jgi:hypothetical protein
MMLHIRPHPRASAPTSRFEDFLRAIGVHPTVAEQLTGDLAEGYREDWAREGRVRAAINVADRALRSLPHLAWSVVRDGGPDERAQLAGWMTGVALVVALFIGVAGMRKGPPARLMYGGQSAGKIVVNHHTAAQLALRVVDARGHRLDSARITYRWLGGAPLPVSSSGVVTCRMAGDAVVRASVGDVNQQLLVSCLPVLNLEALTSEHFFVGDAPRKLTFAARGFDGRRINELRGTLRILDTTIAKLSGVTVTPLKSGKTVVLINIGDATAYIHILVREYVERFTGLRPDQRFVVVPIHLTPGDSTRFALPTGVYWLAYQPGAGSTTRPTIIFDGCVPGERERSHQLPEFVAASKCNVDRAGASVLLRAVDGIANGSLSLQFVGLNDR